MRRLFWLVNICILLGVIGFVGYIYFRAPDKNKFYAIQGFAAIGRNYVSGQPIDLNAIKGNDDNAEYLKILGTCFQTLESTDQELAKQTSLLMVSIQSRNLSSAQSLDLSIQRAADYQKLVKESYAKTEIAMQQMSNDMNKLATDKKFIFDTKTLVDSISTQKPHRDKKYEYYNGLALYVKTTIEFAKSRTGYFKISTDGNYLVFTRPVDQDYYNKLVSGIGAYQKQIEQFNSDDMTIIRNQVSQAEGILASAKR